MKMYDWSGLKRLRDKDEFHNKLKVGDCFLYGSTMVAQHETKKEGDLVTYYKVLSMNEEYKSVEYVTIFDKLES
jgi:hypothetical protein